MKNICIIWAWAAWLMTAATILEWHPVGDYHIHLFEKNTSPGKKVIISGGGRCNVTTGVEDKKILEMKYTRWWNFIKKSFWKFWPRKTRDWFESHGIPLKMEVDMRIFPVSDNGKDIVWVFEDVFEKHKDKITLHFGEGVSEVFSDDSTFYVITSKWEYTSDFLIITTGGNAYSHTGSSGDGYAFARSLGHTVTELWPSLSSFLTKEIWTHELSGLAFEHARIGSLHWPLLLTHFGISWPLAFMISSEFAWDRIDKEHPRVIKFSPISWVDVSDWENFLKNSFSLHPKKILSSMLSEKLPRRFAEAFAKEHFPHLEATFASSISRTDRERIAELLGNGIPLMLLERRPWDEFVTAGGVVTEELESETMESKLQKNLYFAGEVLNVDGYTWGFSLQICWASGYVVGKDISSKI